MMYLMLKRCRIVIFMTTAIMLGNRNEVSVKRGQPQRSMNSSNSAPFTRRHIQ